MNGMGVSIPETLTFESNPEGSEEVSHTYEVHKLGDLLILAGSRGAQRDGAEVQQEGGGG